MNTTATATAATQAAKPATSAIPFGERLALSPAQAATMLSISRATIYREMKAGRMPHRKAGVRTLITTEDARAWLGRCA